MAVTLTWDDVRRLAEYRAERGSAISLYLDLAPTDSPTPRDASARVSALLSDGHKDGAARELSHAEKEALKRDFERIERYFEHEFERDGAHGVALFCAGLDDVWIALQLPDAVPDRIKVERDFYLAPLAPLVGRGDGALVAVVNRERGSLYRLRAGRLVADADLSEEQPRRHDQGGWSQSRFQRHIDELAADHFRRVAEEIDRRVRAVKGTRIVIACPEEVRAEFEHLLSQEARHGLAGWAAVEAHAGPPDVQAAVKPVLERARAKEEVAHLDRFREELGRDGRAVGGWAGTLEAASDARVELLLYTEGTQRAAWQCPRCGRASAEAGSCPLDGTPLEERKEGLDVALHHALGSGGSVCVVRDRQDLEPLEGIGALLRF
jgi:peptide chain release factor subunit 1